jgi:WD40 repeat protein
MLAAECQRSDSPFPGLRSFSQDESELFFGREGQSDELARKLGKTRFVAVVGTSGSGKSSLVRAGLLPCLQSGCLVKAGSNWRIVDMRPGGLAIDNLAAALDIAKMLEQAVEPESLRISSLALLELIGRARQATRIQANENVLILVDQFEELFRYANRDNSMAERDEKAAFVKLLLEVSKQTELPVYVVITMRSDFLGDCARFRDLPEAINAGQYLIPRMTRDQRRSAIEGPIRMAGGTITPRLVQRILNELGEDPGQLPVMQHALMRTWSHWKSENRPQDPLDFADYEAIGTMEKAISTHAEEAYEEVRSGLGERVATVVQRLFQRLSDQDQYGRETRRPTPMEELAEVCEAPLDQVGEIVESFRKEGRSFLSPLTGDLTGSRVIDITHECLLRSWDRLHDWNREEEESRRVYLRIATRAQDALVAESDKAVRSPAPDQRFVDYLEGIVLDRSVEWWNQRQPNQAWAKRYAGQFDLAQKYLRESKEHAERIRSRRLVGRTATIAVVGLLVIAGIALRVYKYKSDRETAKVLAMAALAVPQQTPAQTKNPRLSALLADASLGVNATTKAQSILSASLDALPLPLKSLTGEPVYAVEFSPEGKWFAVGGENRIDLYDENGVKQKSWTGEGRGGKVKKIIFTAESEVKAAVDKQIVIWGVDSDIRVQLTCPAEVEDFSESEDGRTVVALCGGKAYLWTAPNVAGRTLPTEPDKSKDQSGEVVALAVSADGSSLAYLSLGRIEVLNIGDPLRVPRTIGAPKTIYDSNSSNSAVHITNPVPTEIQFDPLIPDALITADSDGGVRSWRYSQAEKKAARETQSSGFASGSRLGTQASLYSAAESTVLFKLLSSATHLSVNQGGWVTATDDDGNGKIWDIARGVEVVQLGLGMPVKGITASQHGQHLAAVVEGAADHRSSLHLWKLGHYLQSLTDASIRSHGRYVITRPNPASKNPMFTIVDVEKEKIAAEFPETNWNYIPLTISHDGKRIAGFPSSGGLIVNDFSAGKMGEKIWQSAAESIAIYEGTFSFSPDLQYLAGIIDGPKGRHFAVWNLKADASPKTDLPATPEALGMWDFSPDSQSIFVVTDKWGLHRYGIADGRAIPFFWGTKLKFSVVGSSVDGHTGAAVETSNCEDSAGRTESFPQSTIKIFDVPQGLLRSKWAASGCVYNFWFSENSDYIATLDKDKRTIRLWEVASKTERARLQNSEDVLDVDLTAEPKPRIVVVDQAHYNVYSWQQEDLRKERCNRASDDLTPQEWNKYAPDEEYRKHTTCADTPPTLPKW